MNHVDLVVAFVKLSKTTRRQVHLFEPTEAQKGAGNYPKLHVHVHGFRISIENTAGSYRSGKDKNGKEWKQKMTCDYGYFRETQGKDGDHVDCFVNERPEEATCVHIIDQVDPETGLFDEHKCMVGWDTQERARKAYLSNYEEGWKGLGAITTVTLPEFKLWVRSHDTHKPYSRHLVKTAGERVRVVIPTDKPDEYLMEVLMNKKWPDNLGKRRFIGGGIDQGENKFQAAIRELKEELGHDASETDLEDLGVSSTGTSPDDIEHYLRLNNHSITPGDYTPTVGQDSLLRLIRAKAHGDDFIGVNPVKTASLRALRNEVF